MAVRITSNISSSPSLRSLVPKNEISFRPVNQYDGTAIKRLYHADNLDVLNYLIKDSKVCGKVDLIYIDPPYNTGGAFETRDFIHAYDDKYSSLSKTPCTNSPQDAGHTP